MVHWLEIKCSCGGYGQVSSYTLGGTDFLGAKECSDCGGSGRVFISENDRMVEYPGGRFLGSAPGLFKKTEALIAKGE